MATIDLVYFNAGGGHRASALALKAAIANANLPWRVRLVSLFNALDPSNLYQRITGTQPEAWYNTRLAMGWTLGLKGELRVLQTTLRLAHPTLLRRLQQYWTHTKPDVVVSLIPHFNHLLYESVVTALPHVPYVTVLTDLVDSPPHFWIERNQRQHFICGTPDAVEQALAAGHPKSHVHETSGMLLRETFYKPRTLSKQQALTAAGLDAKRPTGLVMFGGHGSRQMLSMARRLRNTQIIFLCGHNHKLAAALRSLPRTAPQLVVEFTEDVPHYMTMADFFIGKPGPGSISEALHMGLPVIVLNNTFTMPQERYNPTWVQHNGLGIAHSRVQTIDEAVAKLLAQLPAYCSRVNTYKNRAFFEIPRILSSIYEDSKNAYANIEPNNEESRVNAPDPSRTQQTTAFFGKATQQRTAPNSRALSTVRFNDSTP